MYGIRWCCLVMLALLAICGSLSQTAQAEPFRVLVVMSYEDTHPFEREIRKAIDSALSGTCEIRYFYMDTKKNLEGGEQKAKEAYALYQEFQPHGVITADDNAQSMFVVPYLKDKVETPVMFCGVNAEPEKYGFPAANVSGILERHHLAESIAFARRLVPSIASIGYIMKDNPSGRENLRQIQSQSDSFGIKSLDAKLVKTLAEALAAAEKFREQCDLLFVANLPGIKDENGNALTDREAVPAVVKAFGKPTIGLTSANVKCGVLCAVVQTGKEQGEIGAEMLLKAMGGTPISEIPITRNKHGKPMLNVNTMKELGIRPSSKVLHTAELVVTEK